jgi:hypothetical protein
MRFDVRDGGGLLDAMPRYDNVDDGADDGVARDAFVQAWVGGFAYGVYGVDEAFAVCV